MNTAQDQQSRGEFEALAASKGMEIDYHRTKSGRYRCDVTDAAWSFWQAARALPAGMEPVAYIDHHKGGDNLEWDNPGPNNSPLYSAAQVQALLVAGNSGNKLPAEASSKQIVLMAGAILSQAHGTADTRHPGWTQAVQQAERAYRALVAA